MATVRPLMLVPPPSHDVPSDSWNAFVARIGTALSAIERRSDEASWEKAQLIIDADHEADTRPDMQGMKRWQRRRELTKALSQYWQLGRLPHPMSTFISHARKVYDQRPELFVSGHKKLPYLHYSRIWVSSLRREQKEALEQWAENDLPSREQIRLRIRQEIDTLPGVYRPDFEVKYTNHWIFNNTLDKRDDGFDGGVNSALYANLIHYFSDPEDTVIDPCAGGGLLADTLKRWEHFKAATKADFGGPRYPLMCDIVPTRPDIVAADARKGLPFPASCAALAILDPPYFKIPEGKYTMLGKTIEQWLVDIRAFLRATQRCLLPDGLVAIMTDDYVHKGYHEPLGHRILLLLLEEGWELVTTIYNFNRNFTAMTPMEMARYKKNRLLLNGVKTIQVALRPQ
jgi:hypothetical protein